MSQSGFRRLSLALVALLLAVAVVFGVGPAQAQGPADDVPFKDAEQLRVPLQEGKQASPEAQKEAGTDCYPCSYWVTGIRIQKLAYPQYQALTGWQFTVYNAANQQVAQATTGPNGVADFFGLPPGRYRVVETPQVNWIFYYPASGEVVLPVYGGYVTFFRFYNRQGGIVPPPTPVGPTLTPPPPGPSPTPGGPPLVGTLKVCKVDVSNPGQPLPVAGWVFSYQQLGGTASGSFPTQANQGGCESVIQLPVGSYRVQETLQSGWEFVGVVPDSDGPNNLTTVVPVQSGQTTTVIFQNRRTQPQTGGVIRACKLDVSGTGERAVSGWPIGIQQQPAAGGYRYGYTGYDGCVTFGNLPTGTYHIEESRINGWEFVTVTPDDGADPGYRTSVTLAGGETQTVTFRNRRLVPASIKVCKLGVFGSTEQPVNNWQMTLRRPDNTPLASGLTGTYYSGPGCVTFGNLQPGTYVIEETSYPGWTLVSVTPDDANTTDNRTTITVGNGESKDVTFRNRRLP